jgi:hypothetical protein
MIYHRNKYGLPVLIPITFAFAVLTSSVNAIANDTQAIPSKSSSTQASNASPTLLEKIGLVSTRPLGGSDLARLHIKNGLVLETVEGISAISGVQTGDILISINGRDTRFGSIEKLPEDFPMTIVLLVVRENERVPIAVQLPPKHRTLFTK